MNSYTCRHKDPEFEKEMEIARRLDAERDEGTRNFIAAAGIFCIFVFIIMGILEVIF